MRACVRAGADVCVHVCVLVADVCVHVCVLVLMCACTQICHMCGSGDA